MRIVRADCDEVRVWLLRVVCDEKLGMTCSRRLIICIEESGNVDAERGCFTFVIDCFIGWNRCCMYLCE